MPDWNHATAVLHLPSSQAEHVTEGQATRQLLGNMTPGELMLREKNCSEANSCTRRLTLCKPWRNTSDPFQA